MSGIYIHIPFCKQACHYCDFHFSTQLQKRGVMINALQQELQLRKNEFERIQVKTIYFGGGTPSVLKTKEVTELVKTVYKHYDVANNAEITLEANPDDLQSQKLVDLNESPINRLSIGVQSFFDDDLKLMNRAHNAEEAMQSILQAKHYFDNISIDLIYGIPGMSLNKWQQNVEKALSLAVPHISSYALTVEPNTALAHFIANGRFAETDDQVTQQHFEYLVETLEAAGYIGYEISNFGKTGYFSQNNTAYWQGKKYLGIGPSAHSYDGQRRGWNVRNNTKYIDAITNKKLPIEIELLSTKDQYNEYVMTGLRTIWGVSMDVVMEKYGSIYLKYLKRQSEKFRNEGLLYLDNNRLLVTKKGKFLCDGIAADLFMINLEKK